MPTPIVVVLGASVTGAAVDLNGGNPVAIIAGLFKGFDEAKMMSAHNHFPKM
jgi:hypothetical protein